MAFFVVRSNADFFTRSLRRKNFTAPHCKPHWEKYKCETPKRKPRDEQHAAWRREDVFAQKREVMSERKKSCSNFLFASRIAREIAMKKRLARCARNTRMGRCRKAGKTETVNAQCDFTKSNLPMKNTAKSRSTRTVKTKPSRIARDGQATQNESAQPEFSDAKVEASVSLLPRVIRLKDASRYLGMDRNRFNQEVRPDLVEIPIGRQGIGFDRLDLDAWFEAYKKRNGRPGPRAQGDEPWDARKYQASSNGATLGTSTSRSEADAFAKALARAMLPDR